MRSTSTATASRTRRSCCTPMSGAGSTRSTPACRRPTRAPAPRTRRSQARRHRSTTRRTGSRCSSDVPPAPCRPEPALCGLRALRASGEDAREVVEARVPAVLVLPARLLARQVAVGQLDARAVAVGAEVDGYAARLARGLPRPGVDQPVGPPDLDVLAADGVLAAGLRITHRQPVAAARAQVDLGERRLPARAGRPPSLKDVGVRPRVEHRVGRRVEAPRHAELVLLGRGCFAHCSSRRSLACSPRYSSTTSNLRSHSARWRSIHSDAPSSGACARRSVCLRPSIARTTTPASWSTRRWRLIAGLETGKPRVASPTLAGPVPSRSTIARRSGWARAAKLRSSAGGLLTITLT